MKLDYVSVFQFWYEWQMKAFPFYITNNTAQIYSQGAELIQQVLGMCGILQSKLPAIILLY